MKATGVPGEGVAAEMADATILRLLDLNRRFYASVGVEFDRTRQGLPGGVRQSFAWLPPVESTSPSPLRVLDVGCGNGRLARALEGMGRPVDYTGVDVDAGLLHLAAVQTSALLHLKGRFVQADVADPGWHRAWDLRTFDVVFCLATIHHLPSAELRYRVLVDMVNLANTSLVILSTWQFQNSPRLMARIQPWSAIGLTPDDVETGDVLLPWDQGVHALRYVHLLTADEIGHMASTCGLRVHNFAADGAEGNLNLYSILMQS